MSPVLSTTSTFNEHGIAIERERADWDAGLAEVAGLQHGVVAGWQANTLGIDHDWIARAVRRKRLHPMSESVYAVGHPAVSRRGRAIAAVLRGGEGTVVSHLSAARLWGLVNESTDGPIHVSLGRRRGLQSSDDVTVHRPRTLSASDVTTHRGLPVTTPERTIRDLLRESSVADVTRMLEQMVTHLNRSPDELHQWGHALTRTPGLHVLHDALDEIVAPVVLRSELERRFRTLCQHAGLPLPETNARIANWEVDAAWRRHRVAVELDSWRWHGGRWQFHRDRRKGLALSRAGYELLRLTWPQIKHESREVVETLQIVLDRRAPQNA